MKKFFALLVVFALCFSSSGAAFADSVIAGESIAVSSYEAPVEPLAEETEWVYRVYNGNLEKRLWSNTYGVWKTDWIYVGPASLVE